jgi:2-dehydro-3-deoxyphosphogluconate aldolase/(4S)-4-hydroxy-2-oxoglutarate aldolase
MDVLSQLLQHKIIAIVRGARPEDVLPIAEALHSSGIGAMEITLNSDGAFDLIGQLSKKMQGKMLVGAGTVLDADAAAQAIESGARFIIAPSLDVATIKRTKELGAVSIPGAYTATEVLTAFKAGGDIIKIFPASQPQYIKDLRGPLDHIPMMPTGGVTLENIAAFQQAGAVAFGIGSSLVDARQPVTSEYLQTLATKAAQFVQAVNNI